VQHQVNIHNNELFGGTTKFNTTATRHFNYEVSPQGNFPCSCIEFSRASLQPEGIKYFAYTYFIKVLTFDKFTPLF
jgi:hypothetical protein